MSWVLRAHGFDTREAGTGAEALRQMAARPDLVVLDVVLPDMDGREVCGRIKADPATAGTPVLMVSGRAVAAAEQARAVDGGADAYLTKPADPELLVAHARALVRARRAEEAARASDARFRAVVEQSFEAVDLVAGDGTTVYSSPGATRLLGHHPGELVGRNAFALVHPEDRDRVHGAFDRLAASPGVATELVFRGRHADGSYRWLEARAANLVCDRAVRAVVVTYRDVTDRRAAEEGRAFLAEVVEAAGDAIVSVDLDGNIRTWNPAAERLFGYPAAEVVGRPVTGLSPVEGRADTARVVEALLAGGPPATYTADRLRRDGTRVRVAVTASAVRAPDGRVVALAATYRDVTARERAEAELRRTADLLKAVVEGTTDAVFVKDRAGRYLLANRATARFLGRPADSVVGRADADMFDRASARVVRDHDERVMAAGRASTEEETLTAGGQTRTFLVTKAPYRDTAGAVAGVVGISRDVTGKRRVAAERDALLARLQLHIDRLPLAYVLFDADFRVSDWNPAAERMLGYTKAEAVGLGPLALVPPSFRAGAEAILARIRAGDMAAHSVNENRTKDGRAITCEWFNTPLFEGGRFTGLLCLAQDVTGRLALEAQLRQAQKMEAIGRLAGGVAHDFNNLLTVINGYSELVMHKLPPGDPARGLVAEVHKAGVRSAGLTRQLLAFSRQQVLAPKVLDMNAVVADTASMLRRVIGEDVRLSVVPAPGLWPVKADPGQLEQVLLNLAVNARDAMPTGGTLTIETRNEDPGEGTGRAHPEGRPGPHVLLAVSDTGQGMTEEVKARIFEPFFTTKEPGRGTGLGLATVFGIVEQSGGHIDVETAVGRGTTFRVSLPRAEAGDGGPRPTSRLAEPPRGTETVLLVEDEGGVRALARHVLAGCGYTVLEAANGAEAERVAAAHPGPVHLVVTDVVMPGGGGREVADRVARRHPGVRVLYVSGYTDDAVVRHGILHDRMPFLQKPFTPAALALKVREVLDA